MKKLIVQAKVYKVQQLNATVRSIEVIAPELASEGVPGQFVNVRSVKGNTTLLRRPLGIADVCIPRGSITLIYRVIGEGTHILADLQPGDILDVVGPLGHGFNLESARPLIVGGGLGLAPLLMLAKFGFGNGRADLVIGGRCADEITYWEGLFRGNVNQTFITSDDGSVGEKGTVMVALEKLLQQDYDCVYVCGPVPMMRAVAAACDKAGKKCQVSLEKYMACGLGACLSCACENSAGQRVKVCQNGPVFWSTEVKEW